MTVFHPESARNSPKLFEAKPLVQMPCMRICSDHCVKLYDPESMPLGLDKTIVYQLLPNMQPSAFRADRITGIAAMAAPSDIVRVKYIQSIFPLSQSSATAQYVCAPKKALPVSAVKQSSWGKAIPSCTTSFQI
jgi:hypothetical protein